MNSIRRELTLRLLVGTSLILVAASIALCVLIWSLLLDGFDDALEVKARAIAALTSREGNRIESDFDEESMPEFIDDDNPEYLQILFQDGSLIDESESMEDFENAWPELGSTSIMFGNIELPRGEDGRFVQLVTRPIAEEEELEDEEDPDEEDEVIFDIPESVDAETTTILIRIAKGREGLDNLLGTVFLAIATIDILVLGSIFFVVKDSIRRGLKPLDNVNVQIAEVRPESPEGRIYVTRPPSELRVIIQTLNELLDRIDTVITRERRFTSDVAHELRTPVSELRTACEVALLSPEDAESSAEFFRDISETAQQMEKVVSNLLSLSRWDQEQATLTIEDIELDALVRNCWEHCAAEAEEKSIRLDCRIDTSAHVTTDREKLEMIVRNLLENAVAYSVPGSRIRCILEPGNPSLRLSFENQAVNLCREDLNHLFDRFWRKEVARSEVHHSGLGLSIVKALADMLGMRIKAELLDDSWFRVCLTVSV